MNRLHAPMDRPLTTDGSINLKTFGVGVIVGLALKGLITTALMVMVMVDFFHY